MNRTATGLEVAMPRRPVPFWLARLGPLLLTLALAAPVSWAQALSAAKETAPEFLDVEQAFQLDAELEPDNRLTFHWRIAPGYRLYRERLKFGVEGTAAELGVPELPPGQPHVDESQGKVMETYHDRLAAAVALRRASAPFVLKLSYQGCAEAGLCYPPVDLRLAVDPARPAPLLVLPDGQGLPGAYAAAATIDDDSSLAQKTLQDGSLWRIGLAFLVFGLLLSLTPCVLPMIPILSSIIVGQGQVSRGHCVLLAAAYCLGMATVYTAMGVAAGLAGSGMAAALQTPWVLGLFAGLLVLLSLSMFDVYQLQLPASLQTWLGGASGALPGGRLAGVLAMGALSALIVGPCVAAPLAGALLYISQTKDALKGGWALFSMAGGMSVPLLLTGASAGSLLPRAGAWMNGVKRVFGMLLLGTAIWMVGPVLPTPIVMLAVGGWAVLAAVFLQVFEGVPANAGAGRRFGKAFGLVLLIGGIFEIAGAASGGRDVLQPLAHWRSQPAPLASAATSGLSFKRLTSVADLDRELAQATAPVMLDFYADWCVACKEMEHFTFRDPQVATRMRQFTLLQADVTANDDASRALLKRFALFGPPAVLLFDAQARELVAARVVGSLSNERFAARLDLALNR